MTLGGAVIAGALVMVLVLSQVGETTATRPAPAGPLGVAVTGTTTTTTGPGSSDVTLAAGLGALAAGAVVLLGLVAWVTLRHDPWFDETLAELYASGWVRAIGIPLTAGALGGVVFVIAEHATATAEHPADLADVGPTMGGTAVLTLLVYLPLVALAWLVRRLRGLPPEAPSNPAAPPA